MCRTKEVNREDAQGVERVEGEVGTERERVIIRKATEDGEDLMAVERRELSNEQRWGRSRRLTPPNST